jgi:hypothetical protein
MKRFFLSAVAVLLCAPMALAQVAVSGKMVGPNAPIYVETSGDGVPGTGNDIPIVPLFDGDRTLTVPNPWENCGPATHNVVVLDQNFAAVGTPFTGGTRTTENQTERIVADQFIGNRPTHFTMTVQKGLTTKQGTGQVIDENSDGIFDALQGGGTGWVNFLLDLVFSDTTGDGWGDYVSIPWSQASALGVDKTDGCVVAGGDPQVWVPMADTNGDGRPDSIVFDLNGDGIPDPQFLPGPVIGAAVVVARNPIPTLSQWAMLLTTLALALAAWMQIRAHGLGA